MKFKININTINLKKLHTILTWMSSEIEDENWGYTISFLDSKDVDIFYFNNEEDKVKFILKWL